MKSNIIFPVYTKKLIFKSDLPQFPLSALWNYLLPMRDCILSRNQTSPKKIFLARHLSPNAGGLQNFFHRREFVTELVKQGFVEWAIIP